MNEKRVVILAVNEDQDQFNETVFGFLENELQKHGIHVVNNFAENNIKTMIDDAAEKTDTFIIVSDAVRGKNPFFAAAAKELYHRKIKPIILVANIDNPKADPDGAANALEEVWLLENPNLESWQMNFETVYLSLERNVTYVSPIAEKEGIQALLETLERRQRGVMG